MLRIDLVGCPLLHSVGGQIVQLDLAEVRQDVVAEDRVVVAER
jgi:hypothetical protein